MNAGIVTAYGSAVAGGYRGTYEEFCEYLASLENDVNIANTAAYNAQSYANDARESAEDAAESAELFDMDAITNQEIESLIGG